MIRRPPRSTLFPLHDALPICPGAPRKLFRRAEPACESDHGRAIREQSNPGHFLQPRGNVLFEVSASAKDRKSTRLNSSHGYISYAVFCLKKKKTNMRPSTLLS